jgi:uncharacterized membrane protein
MNTKIALIVVILLLAGALGASLALYSALPDRMPTHWNLRGQVDGWGAKSFAAFLLPGVMLLLLLLLVGGEWISPVNFKIEPFRSSYNYLMVICAALMGFLHALILLAGLDPARDLGRWMVGGFFLFFAWLGNLLGKTRRNFWIGIRTPWTLASDAVWNATHRLGARILYGVGLAGALLVAAGLSLVFCFCLLMAGLLVPVVYSFWLSKKLERESTSS